MTSQFFLFSHSSSDLWFYAYPAIRRICRIQRHFFCLIGHLLQTECWYHDMSTAILVDLAFFLNRVHHVYPEIDSTNPEAVGKALISMCMLHVENEDLYRILAYDCTPVHKKSHHPVAGELIDFSEIKSAVFRVQLHNYLKRKRKVALRLGHLVGNAWVSVHSGCAV